MPPLESIQRKKSSFFLYAANHRKLVLPSHPAKASGIGANLRSHCSTLLLSASSLRPLSELTQARSTSSLLVAPLADVAVLLLLYAAKPKGIGHRPWTVAMEIEFDMPGFMRVHKNGLVERLTGTDTVPPCPSGDPANGVASKDIVLDPAANISARLYLPPEAAAAGKRLPVVVFFHGGAFFVESPSSPIYHRYATSLAAAVPAVVLSVDYHLAPEHPLPAAYDDAFAALKAVVAACRPDGAEPWLAAHGDAARLCLVGDSAGANIAHNTAVRLRKERIDGVGDKVSGVALMHSYFWGTERMGGESADAGFDMDRVWDVACGGNYGRDHKYINPASSPEEWRLLGCGRVLVTAAEHCWFVERARAYAEGIKASGWDGEVEFYETKGERHTYFLFKPDCDTAAKELAVVADFVRRC